jgi:PAS domain S-box-containing protein
MAEVLRSGKPARNLEVVVERPDGWQVHILANIDPLVDGEGRVVGAINAFVDITQRHSSETALAESEARFRTMADTMPQLVWTADADGTVDYYNARVRQFEGFQWDGEAGRWRWRAVLHPDDATPTARAWAVAVASGREYRIEHRVRMAASKGGGYRWFLSRALPARDDRGRIVKWYGTATDIEATKQAEEALRASEELNRRTLQALPAHIAVIDAAGGILGVNQAWLEFATANGAAGAPSVEVGGNYLAVCQRSAAAQDEGARHALEGIEGVLGGRLPRFTLEYPCHSPQEERWFHMTVVPLGPGGAGGAVITHLDISARMQAEVALREADRRKDEFLATLAHELRNPLAPIASAVEVLRLAPDGPHAASAREMIHRQLAHMVRLIDDLLDVSRITRGRLLLRPERVALGDVIGQAVEGCRPHLERAGQELLVSLPPEPVYLDADPLRLAQVFLNLLNNASRYGGAGGPIRLCAEAEAGQLVVRVIDAGIGIAPERLPGLFELFAQVDPAPSGPGAGLGIGLALSRRLVELHSGTIEARSEGLGRGSELIVRLPLARDAAAPEVPAEGLRPQAVPGRRILIADDDADNADALAMLLRLMGHSVEAARDGLEAVAAAERWRPEVVLLDIGMPGLDGYEACRRIREQPWGRDLAIIALTGWGQEEDRRRTAEAGFDHHLVKPVDVPTLLRVLAETRSA